MTDQDGVPRQARPILLLTFVNAIGGTLLIPVLPFVVRDLGYSDLVFALLIAAYPAAQFFAAPILGSLADHRGRRPILLVSQAGTLLSWVLFAAAYAVTSTPAVALALIAISRLVDGLTGGNASVAAAYLADVVEGEARTRVFSLQGAIAGVALLIGPATGSFTAATSVGFLGPALLAIVISAGTLIWMTTSLTESLPPEARTPEFDANPLHQLNLIGKATGLTGRGPLLRLFGVQGLFTFAFGAYSTIITLWYVDRLGVSERSVGLLLLATGAFLIFNETVTLRFFERRLGDVGTMIAGLVILPVALFAIRFPTSVLTFLPISFILNVGMALVLPTLQSVVTKAADEREEGEVQGINTSVAAVASTFAPVVAGASYAALGGGTTIWLAAAVAAGASVVAVASAALISVAAGEPRPEATHDHHRHHGPVTALAHRMGSGQRSFSLRLHGSSRTHHGLRDSKAVPGSE
ncbi:MAG: MFS transporter [Actinomycetota bacterium]